MIEDSRLTNRPLFDAGPYLAKVVGNVDPTFMGSLQVQLLRNVGNAPNSTASTIQVRYLSPFYGVTNLKNNSANDTYDGTQKSYGMWMVPPDIGSIVMVMFVQGDMKQGYWIGCVQDEFMNFMVPGLAATSLHTDKSSEKKVVAEYNKLTVDFAQPDPTKIRKPVHPLQEVLVSQGLAKDETRGITTSSARRETPSNVFGISTPGPVDRRSGAPTGTVGRREARVVGAHTSRLGGTTFVLDDGDDNFLRKTHASEGPPEYASVENGETGKPDIPHNELVRIRTRTGHQILLHNSEDLIYIANARGTAWIELTSNGKIDIWAADSISMHTAKDFNITADNNINLTAKNNINLYAGNNINATATSDFNLKVGSNGRITVGGSYDLLTTGSNSFTAGAATNILSGGNHVESAAQIHMNGPAAQQAAKAETAIKAPRVPTAEPWPEHENLHGAGLQGILDPFKKVGK